LSQRSFILMVALKEWQDITDDLQKCSLEKLCNELEMQS